MRIFPYQRKGEPDWPILPSYTAVGGGNLRELTGAGTATLVQPLYTASGAGTLAKVTGAGDGNVIQPIYTASGAASLPQLTGSGGGVIIVGGGLIYYVLCG